MELPLPASCFPDPDLYNTKIVKNYIEKYVKSTVPKGDLKNLEQDFNYTFVLARFSHVNTKKQRKVKRNFLTRKQRKELNLLKLPKNGWDYQSLSGIHEMWKQYLRQNLDFPKKTPTYQDQDWLNFTTIIAKSELIGAEVTVVRSKVPTQIGMTGILVLETKMTFQLVTPASQLKTILKETSVFEFRLDNMKFTIFGKHLMTRASERSVKKIKGHMIPDLS
ncbi:ribonuclease P protein subunit p29 [Coccinella septempunctata]|uniref:ribonuclease P protein subunit p29 n=1 Tax=Coccinella septempunctata TaxID=41139 RepID=UPI001D087A5F|nr:ribonuclease P protein subunit p29 [Coccinella septempunctata]